MTANTDKTTHKTEALNVNIKSANSNGSSNFDL